MPIYEYECQKCGKNFEEIQGIHDKPLKKCSFCDGPAKRVMSQTSFSLKGGGWYKDGYSSSKGLETGAKKTASPQSTETPKKASAKDS